MLVLLVLLFCRCCPRSICLANLITVFEQCSRYRPTSFWVAQPGLNHHHHGHRLSWWINSITFCIAPPLGNVVDSVFSPCTAALLLPNAFKWTIKSRHGASLDSLPRVHHSTYLHRNYELFKEHNIVWAPGLSFQSQSLYFVHPVTTILRVSHHHHRCNSILG